jgi:hypothetical protein
MPKLTQEQLEAVRQRAENATPGPWETCEISKLSHAKWFGVLGGGSDDSLIDIGVDTLNEADATFIAHARTDIPALLEHIAELEAELARLKDALINTERKEIVRTYYRQVHERFSKSPDGSFEEEYCSGIMSGIKTTLDLLGITIEGVND